MKYLLLFTLTFLSIFAIGQNSIVDTAFVNSLSATNGDTIMINDTIKVVVLKNTSTHPAAYKGLFVNTATGVVYSQDVSSGWDGSGLCDSIRACQKTDSSRRVVAMREGQLDTIFYGDNAGDLAVTYAGSNTEVYRLISYADSLTSTKNWAVDGVSWYFHNTYVANTTGDLFNINDFTEPFSVEGSGRFYVTVGNIFERSSGSTAIDSYFECNGSEHSSATATDAIYINGAIKFDDLTFKGWFHSTGGYTVWHYPGATGDIETSQYFGKYTSTNKYSIFWIGTDGEGLNITASSITTGDLTGTQPALYLNSSQSSTSGQQATVQAGEIKGSFAVSLVGNPVSVRDNSVSVYANMIGDIFITGGDNAFNISGTIQDSEITLDGGSEYDVVRIDADCYDVTFIITDEPMTLQVDGCLNYTDNGYPLVNNGLYAGSNLIINGHIYNEDDNWTLANVDGGNVYINGGKSGESANFNISGGQVNLNSDWIVKDGSNLAAFTMTGGAFKLNSQGRIEQKRNNATCVGIDVNDDAKFIHDGGVIKVGATATSIDVANTKTLTIRNYNNYYTNYARAGAGTYTETITSGGTEIVDTDVE